MPAAKKPENKAWLTTAEAAAYLGLNQATIRRWADDKTITGYTTPGGHRRFRVADLDKVMKKL